MKLSHYTVALNVNCWLQYLAMVFGIKETIHVQDSDNPSSPLIALSLFLIQQQPSLYLYTHSHDPIIIQLYETAFTLVYDDQFFEQDFVSSIETVCDTNGQLFKRMNKKISSRMDMDKIKRICQRGIEYNREVKHRLLNNSNSDSSQELELL